MTDLGALGVDDIGLSALASAFRQISAERQHGASWERLSLEHWYYLGLAHRAQRASDALYWRLILECHKECHKNGVSY